MSGADILGATAIADVLAARHCSTPSLLLAIISPKC
jgi:purine nucleoside phosphorylase